MYITLHVYNELKCMLRFFNPSYYVGKNLFIYKKKNTILIYKGIGALVQSRGCQKNLSFNYTACNGMFMLNVVRLSKI